MFEEDKEYKFNPKEIKIYGPKINEAQQIDPNKTEHEIMLERNIYRIYDSGNLKFKYIHI